MYYMIRTLRKIPAKSNNQYFHYLNVPGNEYYMQLDEFSLPYIQEVASVLAYAERQLAPHQKSTCIYCIEVKEGEELKTSNDQFILLPTKSSLDTSEGYTGIMTPRRDREYNLINVVSYEELEPVLTGHIGCDALTNEPINTPLEITDYLDIEVAFSKYMGKARKLVYRYAERANYHEWGEEGNLKLKSDSHLLSVRAKAYQQTMRTIVHSLCDIKWKDGKAVYCGEFTGNVTVNCLTNRLSSNNKEPRAQQVYEPDFRQFLESELDVAVRAMYTEAALHFDDFARYDPMPVVDHVATWGHYPNEGEYIDYTHYKAPWHHPHMPDKWQPYAEAKRAAGYDVQGDFKAVDEYRKALYLWMYTIGRTLPRIGLDAINGAKRRANERKPNYPHSTGVTWEMLFYEEVKNTPHKLIIAPYVNYDAMRNAYLDYLCMLCFYERGIKVKRKKSGKQPKRTLGTQEFTNHNGNKARRVVPSEELQRLVLPDPPTVDYEGYALYVPIVWDVRQHKLDEFNRFMERLEESTINPIPPAPRRRTWAWDHTIHPLTPEEEDEEAVAFLEDVEERAKIGSGYIYKVVELYATSKGVKVPPSWVVVPVVNHYIDGLNPTDAPPDLGTEMTIDVVDALTTVRVSGVTVFSPVGFGQLVEKLKNGDEILPSDIGAIAGL